LATFTTRNFANFFCRDRSADLKNPFNDSAAASAVWRQPPTHPSPHRAYVCLVVSCEEVSQRGFELSISKNLLKIVKVKLKI